MNFLHALGQLLGSKQSTPNQTPQNTHGFLGIKLNGPLAQSTPVYAPKTTPTPTISLPRPDLQRYGDSQGNQWFENSQGQHFPVPVAPQPFDAPWVGRQQQFLRPGVRGALPGSDATVHVPIPPKNLLRSI